ncbi:carbohydrate sulfotransferase 1-like [Liolophura sinensis]|uniref:carbohydrate sulfotransferase 1-like n=1 Tax=Liolophura sinensis TaxID=3198878 RepID=UPI00315856E4
MWLFKSRRRNTSFALLIAAILVISYLGYSLIDDMYETVYDSLPSFKENSVKLAANDKAIKVLIVAYYRSGSTLTGSLFDDNPVAFYSFEPLYPLYLHTIAKGYPVKYFNGTVRECPDKLREDETMATEILSAIYSCRFQDFDVATATKQLCNSVSKSILDFCHCVLQKKGNLEMVPQDCFPAYYQRCAQAKYRVVKSVRVGMDVAKQLIQQYPEVKVIHLLRDPRAMFCSNNFGANCVVDVLTVEAFCRRITKDFKERQLLEREYPSSFKEVIFEDLVADPVGVAKDIYSFVNSRLPDYMAKLLLEKTHSKSDGPYGTRRENSTATAYKWTKIIGQRTITMINSHCSELIKHGKFPQIITEKDLRGFRIPQRPFKE